MKKLSTFALGIAAAVALAGTASAECLKKVALTSTGIAADASGTAEARAKDDGRQRIKVSADARVADGTTFAVYINGMLARTMTFALGSGEAEINNTNGALLPLGVGNVCAAASVEVKDASGMVVLTGQFN